MSNFCNDKLHDFVRNMSKCSSSKIAGLYHTKQRIRSPLINMDLSSNNEGWILFKLVFNEARNFFQLRFVTNGRNVSKNAR